VAEIIKLTINLQSIAHEMYGNVLQKMKEKLKREPVGKYMLKIRDLIKTERRPSQTFHNSSKG